MHVLLSNVIQLRFAQGTDTQLPVDQNLLPLLLLLLLPLAISLINPSLQPGLSVLQHLKVGCDVAHRHFNAP